MNQGVLEYHINGNVKSQFDGTTYKEFRENGSLKIEVPSYSEYRVLYHGLWKSWDILGNLVTTINYNRGVKEGEVCRYYNGKLKRQFNIINSYIKHGESKEWNSKGILISYVNFYFDKLHGEYKKWDNDGNLIEDKMYINGVEQDKKEGVEVRLK